MPLRQPPLPRHDAGAEALTAVEPSLQAPGARTPASAAADWQAESLWQQLEPRLPGLSIEIVPRCGSTNTVLLERARAGALEPAVLVAEQQTAGRGRQGRAWLSEPGSALLMSLALPLAPRDWSGLSLAVGVAVADALEPGGVRIGLKWPNDLWLRDLGAPGVHPVAGQGRKLAGILIETVAAGAERIAVIGIGINVRPVDVAASAQALQTGYAHLSELDARATPARALQAVLPVLLGALQRFEQQGLAASAAGWQRRDLLRGCRVQASGPTPGEGLALGVAADGSLRIGLDDGRELLLNSGEVQVRPVAVPAGAH